MKYTIEILNFLCGIIFYYLGFNLSLWTFIHIIFEICLRIVYKSKILNILINIILGILGWLFMYTLLNNYKIEYINNNKYII